MDTYTPPYIPGQQTSFNDLPPELSHMIWRLTYQPRTVHLNRTPCDHFNACACRVLRSSSKDQPRNPFCHPQTRPIPPLLGPIHHYSRTALPVAFHICQASRQLAQKDYSPAFASPMKTSMHTQDRGRVEMPTIYFNFAIDELYIMDIHFPEDVDIMSIFKNRNDLGRVKELLLPVEYLWDLDEEGEVDENGVEYPSVPHMLEEKGHENKKPGFWDVEMLSLERLTFMEHDPDGTWWWLNVQMENLLKKVVPDRVQIRSIPYV